MLSPEDKQLIAEWMGWEHHNVFNCYCRRGEQVDPVINFDSNDASLCVEKMVEKGDWEGFEDCMADIFLFNFELECICDNHARYIAWLFNPDNFFQAMAEWLRSRK